MPDGVELECLRAAGVHPIDDDGWRDRRSSARHAVNWAATVVFDPRSDRPDLQTLAQDVSAGGASILSRRADLSGAIVGMLLRPTVSGTRKSKSRLFTQVARIVSTIATADGQHYRYGLSFVRPNHEIPRLALAPDRSIALARTAAESPPVQPRAANDDAECGRLSQLQRLAERRIDVARGCDSPATAVSDTLRRIHAHLKSLAEILDVLKLAYPPGCYAIAGVPDFCKLVWADASVGFSLAGQDSSNAMWTDVWFRYRLSSNAQLRVVRDYPSSERLRQTLTENRIDFDTLDERNERGAVVRTAFMFPCKVAASLVFEAAPDGRHLVLKMCNVERFGIVEALVAPDQIDDSALDELVAYILAETRDLRLLNDVRSR